MQTNETGLLQKMMSMYSSGMTSKQIAENTGKGIATVHRWLTKSGIEMRVIGAMRKGQPWSAARRSYHPVKEPEPKPEQISNIGCKSISSHGYIQVNVGEKHSQYEHILVAEKALGRRLKKGEVVHHINCNKKDNRPKNLLVCRIGYHLKLHARMRRHAYWSQFSAPLKHP